MTDRLIGKKFRWTVQDGHPEFTVIRKSGRNYECVVEDDSWVDPKDGKTYPGDFEGYEMVFSKSQIERAIKFEEFWAELGEKDAVKAKALSVGQTIHVSNGFAQYVRGTVTGIDGKSVSYVPTGMVGNWHEGDLPRRMYDGSVYNGYHAEKIIKGEESQAGASNIWELKDAEAQDYDMRGLKQENLAHLNAIGKARFNEQRYTAPFDPAKEPAISLTLPPLDVDEERTARAYRLGQEAKALIDEAHKEMYGKDPVAQYSMLQDAFNKAALLLGRA